MAAVVRALHFVFESPVVFADPYAGRLAGPVWHLISKSRLLYRIGTQTIYKGLTPIRRQVLARARYAEDKLEKAMEAGITQYIIIGAGFDSFALRRKDLTDKIFIYELDHPASQQSKQDRLAKLNFGLPSTHEFVPVDFELQSVGEALERSSYNSERPAFFSWLGTVHYLSKPAVFNTLKSISACSCAGSELVFDYAAPESSAANSDQQTIKKLKRFTRRRGEPIISMFDPDYFPEQVSKIGFELMENLSPEAQADRYFKQCDGKRVKMPGSYFVHFCRPTK